MTFSEISSQSFCRTGHRNGQHWPKGCQVAALFILKGWRSVWAIIRALLSGRQKYTVDDSSLITWEGWRSVRHQCQMAHNQLQ